MHGYAMVKEYRERSGIDVSTGNFYRELQRLVLDGLIQAAANPPGVDARRTPYGITDLGITVFDEWYTSQQAAAGAPPEDDISSRALFVADLERAVVARVLDRLEENLWFVGKTLERDRQIALTLQTAVPAARFNALPLLLARRLKHVAADLEFVEEFRAAYERVAGSAGAADGGVRAVRPARKRELAVPPPTARRW